MNKTNLNKELFFCLYWGQEVCFYGTIGSDMELLFGKGVIRNLGCKEIKDCENHYLELTPLSSITPEHAIEVCKLISAGSFYTKKKWNVSHVENGDARYVSITSKRSSHIFEIDYDGILHVKDEETFFVPDMVLPNYLPAFQYLISKGYALPYMGIQVETLIEWGWIKLKE